jgi:transposase
MEEFMAENQQSKKRKTFSNSTIRAAVKRVRDGESVQKVADDVGVHFTTIHNWKNKVKEGNSNGVSANGAGNKVNKSKPKPRVTPIQRNAPYLVKIREDVKAKLNQLEKEADTLRKILEISK